MSDNTMGLGIAMLVATVIGPILAWVSADGRSKGRIDSVTKEQAAQALTSNNNSRLIGELQVAIGKSEQDRLSIHRDLTDKASKEVVDGFRDDLAEMRSDMDKRFDRLETLLTARSKGV